jgi:putative transposase
MEFITCKKIKIYPTKNQKETFDFWLRRCLILYNVALQEKISYYKVTNKYLNVYDQKKELTDIKDFDSSWKDIPNKSLQEIIFRVDNTFKSFFKRGFKGFPKYQKELNTIEFVKTDVRFKDGKLYLPKIKDLIKVKEEIPLNYSSVKLTRNNDNYYLVFTLKENKRLTKSNDDILGIDLGLKDLYTTSNGDKGLRFSQKLIKKYQYRIKYLNKSLSKKNKGSKRFKKVKKHLGKAYQRLNNTKTDYLHKQANKLLECKEHFIALGNINIQSIIENKKTTKGLIKSFYVNSLGQFKQYVIYKSIKYNKEVILVDERLTSKACSCCGKIKYDLTLKDRIYNCLCGNSIDRDKNAAINMKMLGSSSLKLRFVPETEMLME